MTLTKLDIGGVRISKTAMVLPNEMTIAQWQSVGVELAGLVNASAWALGDWAHWGEWRFGSKYRTALAVTGLEYQTLRNYASIAGRFDVSRRRDKLSFAHHAEVAVLPVPEQDAWLDKAERYGWSRQQLRYQLRPTELEPPTNELALVRVTVEPERKQLWERAAEVAEVGLVDWVANTLDAAALAELGSAFTATRPSALKRKATLPRKATTLGGIRGA